MQFQSAVESFFNSLAARRRSPATLTWYREQFTAFTAWRGDRRADLPDASEIDAFLADQHAAGLAPATVHARFRALRARYGDNLTTDEVRREMKLAAAPALTEDAPRSFMLRVRMTEAERTRLQEMADHETNGDMSDLVRRRLFE